MATLTLSIPDQVLARATARMGERGRANLEEYLLAVVEALTLDGQPVDPETEAQLLESLDAPAVEMTEADWQALRDRARRGSKR